MEFTLTKRNLLSISQSSLLLLEPALNQPPELGPEVDKTYDGIDLAVHRWGVVKKAFANAKTDWQKNLYQNMMRSLERHKDSALNPYPIYEGKSEGSLNVV